MKIITFNLKVFKINVIKITRLYNSLINLFLKLFWSLEISVKISLYNFSTNSRSEPKKRLRRRGGAGRCLGKCMCLRWWNAATYYFTLVEVPMFVLSGECNWMIRFTLLKFGPILLNFHHLPISFSLLLFYECHSKII